MSKNTTLFRRNTKYTKDVVEKIPNTKVLVCFITEIQFFSFRTLSKSTNFGKFGTRNIKLVTLDRYSLGDEIVTKKTG